MCRNVMLGGEIIMDLKLISEDVSYHPGYGAGPGEVIREEYECPCGNGKVIYEKDAIPGFRSSDTWITCKVCDEKYTFGRGIATLK